LAFIACLACFDGDAGVRGYAGLEYAESRFEKLMRALTAGLPRFYISMFMV
jgi:hypothetical protein